MARELSIILRDTKILYSNDYSQAFPFLIPVFGAKAKLWGQNSGMEQADFQKPVADLLALADIEKEEVRSAPPGILQACEHADVAVFDLVPAVKDIYQKKRTGESLLTDLQKERLMNDFEVIEKGIRDNGVDHVGQFIAYVITQKVMGNYLSPFFPQPPKDAKPHHTIAVYEEGRMQSRVYREYAKTIEKNKPVSDGKDYSDVTGMGGQYKMIFRTNGNTPDKFLEPQRIALEGVISVATKYLEVFPEAGPVLDRWYSIHAPGMIDRIKSEVNLVV